MFVLKNLGRVKVINVTATAQEVNMQGFRCVLQNADASNNVYITDVEKNGVATVDNSMIVFPKETTQHQWALSKVSVVCAAGQTAKLHIISVE